MIQTIINLLSPHLH